jgi:hypothetical protein
LSSEKLHKFSRLNSPEIGHFASLGRVNGQPAQTSWQNFVQLLLLAELTKIFYHLCADCLLYSMMKRLIIGLSVEGNRSQEQTKKK